MEDKIRTIKNLIRKDNLQEAFEEIDNFFSNHQEYDDFILQEARFNEIRREYNRGITDFKESSQVKSHIRKSLLELLNEINPQKRGGGAEVTFPELVICPTFLKKTTKFRRRNADEYQIDSTSLLPPMVWNDLKNNPDKYYTPLGSTRINHSLCNIKIEIKNTGSTVLEDWKLWLSIPEGVKKFYDDFTTDIFLFEKLLPYRTTWANNENRTVLCKPYDNAPLIQKEIHCFIIKVIPKIGVQSFDIKWELLARNFDASGVFSVKIEPQYKEEEDVVFSPNEKSIMKESISEYIELIPGRGFLIA